MKIEIEIQDLTQLSDETVGLLIAGKLAGLNGNAPLQALGRWFCGLGDDTIAEFFGAIQGPAADRDIGKRKPVKPKARKPSELKQLAPPEVAKATTLKRDQTEG
jgi:hypothetical protein